MNKIPNKNDYQLSEEEKTWLINLPTKLTWEEVKKLFELYDNTFTTKSEICRCSGKIRRMVRKLKIIAQNGK